jgi:outer membrane protein
MRNTVLSLGTAGLVSCATVSAMAAEPCPAADLEGLSLPQFLARAGCLDARVAGAAAEDQRAQAAQREAQAARAWHTQLHVTPSLATQTGSGGGRQSGAIDAQWQAQRTLLDGGAREAVIEQRTLERHSASEDARALRQDVLKELVGLWADAREAQVNFLTAQGRLATARLSSEAVRARLAVGSATQVDLLSVLAEQAQAESEWLQAGQACVRQQGLIASRLGREPLQDGCRPSDRGDSDDSAPTQALLARWQRRAAALETLSAEHPQLKSQWLATASREAAIRAAAAQDKPSLNLGASLGPNVSRSNAASPGGTLASSQRLATSLALTWSLPLGDGGAREARVAQAQATAQAARSQGERLRQSLEENAWRQWVSWQSSQATLSANQASLAAARAAELAQQGRYQAGVGTLLDWLRSQTERSARATQWNSAKQNMLRSLAGVLHAHGQLELEGIQP